MKKIHRISTFFTVPHFFSLAGTLLLTGAGMVLFSACSLFSSSRVFPDAYYNTNFIASLGFGVNETLNATPPTTIYPVMPPFHPATLTLPSRAVWAFDYQYDNWNGFNYMSLTPTGSQAIAIDTSLAGATGTSLVYRLELVNLINRGDFETGNDGAWATTGSATYTPDNVTPLLQTRSMKLEIPSVTTVTYTPTVTGAAMVTGANYYVSYRYLSSHAFNCGSNILEASAPAATTPDSTNFDFNYTGSAPVFSFLPPTTTSSIDNLRVDNFRMVQKNSKMRLRLRLAISDTTPFLESGVYAFRVWVHTDPSAFIDRSPYWLDTFSITMSALDEAYLAADSGTYTASAGAGWVKLTATLSPHALQFHPEKNPQSDQVLELVLDFNASQPGTVLLAQPELEFYPDGL